MSDTTDLLDPNGDAAAHGTTCRRCGEPWPCPGTSSWEGRHFPSLIPNGAVVSTVGDLHRLINWAPRGNCPVVLDSAGVTWILFETEDGDAYAGTMECPDDGVPARYDLDDLPALRGPVRVLFNGDVTMLPSSMQGEDQ
jgi:hypothetical protein